MLLHLSFIGTCYHCSQMFTSSYCRGPQSSTMTRTATSRRAVCYDCNLTTPHSPGVFMPLFPSSGLLYEYMDTHTSLCSRYLWRWAIFAYYCHTNVLFLLSLLWCNNIVNVFIQDMAVLRPLKSLWLELVEWLQFVPVSFDFTKFYNYHKRDLLQVIHKVEGPPSQSRHWV